MKLRAAAFAAITLLFSAPLWAQTNPVVVELFTSQGCSTCPPADALMHKLAQRDDVIPLALHVDYWDYIGWKDQYASPAHTKRQKRYAHFGGRKMIYTPQMIINGQDELVGARAMELADLIMTHKDRSARAAVRLQRDGGHLLIRVEPTAGALSGPLDVHLVRYTPLRRAHITSGENAGRELEYANVVDGWRVLGEWDGAAPLNLKAEIDGDRPAVVLIQRRGPGAIVAAARAD